MYDLAIIGFGPRGLHALECFLIMLSRKRIQKSPRILIIEKQNELGCGSAWSTTQPDENHINISDRALTNLLSRDVIELEGLYIPEFPSFIDWTKKTLQHQVSDEKDTYFKRSVMGKYLKERAHSLIDIAIKTNLLEVFKEYASQIQIINGDVQISLDTNVDNKILSHSAVLTTGHLPTKISSQNLDFKNHACACNCEFIYDPYKSSSYSTYSLVTTAAIKGMGLSMIDIVHLCIKQLDGTFKKQDNSIFLNFDSNCNTNVLLIPFSLNGLPVVPKPLGKIVDDQFSPENDDIDLLKSQITDIVDNPDHVDIDEILKPIILVIQKVYTRLTNLETSIDLQTLIKNWLKGIPNKSELFLNTELETVEYMKASCLMAYGKKDFTLDYVIGQVWRQLQPLLYSLISHSNLQPDVQSEFIKVDDYTKRYSYGPPVDRVLQLIALAEKGIINFNFSNDPDIEEIKDAWRLSNSRNEIEVQTIINGVLASPNLELIDDQLINNMFNDNYLEAYHKKRGININQYGEILTESGSSLNVAVLGRNVKGAAYGVDAILECFGTRIMEWAKHAVSQLN